MNWMQGMQNITEKSKRNLDEVFFNKEGEQICKRQMQNTQKNTRELHLELVGDKVTYVRVY